MTTDAVKDYLEKIRKSCSTATSTASNDSWFNSVLSNVDQVIGSRKVRLVYSSGFEHPISDANSQYLKVVPDQGDLMVLYEYMHTTYVFAVIGLVDMKALTANSSWRKGSTYAVRSGRYHKDITMQTTISMFGNLVDVKEDEKSLIITEIKKTELRDNDSTANEYYVRFFVNDRVSSIYRSTTFTDMAYWLYVFNINNNDLKWYDSGRELGGGGNSHTPLGSTLICNT